MEKLQSKAPRVRFPEFKDEWEHKRLSELLCESKKRNGDLKYGKDWIRRLLDLLNSRTLKLIYSYLKLLYHHNAIGNDHLQKSGLSQAQQYHNSSGT